MQIKVEANDMYDVLTVHGIDVTEAKAIILDLLLRAEGTVLGSSSEAVNAGAEMVEDDSNTQEMEFSSEGEDFEKEDAAVGKVVSSEKPHTKSKLRRKRLNFGAFGGAADSLT